MRRHTCVGYLRQNVTGRITHAIDINPITNRRRRVCRATTRSRYKPLVCRRPLPRKQARIKVILGRGVQTVLVAYRHNRNIK